MLPAEPSRADQVDLITTLGELSPTLAASGLGNPGTIVTSDVARYAKQFSASG